LIEKTEIVNAEQSSDTGETTASVAENKKPFVEPEVSFPIDVLEATTFFQATSSGTTT
jgi:hypothetical protein